MTRRACRHRKSREVYSVLLYAESKGNAVTRRMCIRCGAWLPLGESNDASEAVHIEILLADRIADICQLWEPGEDREMEIWKLVAFACFLDSPVSAYGIVELGGEGM
jgi:hypothetical protein